MKKVKLPEEMVQELLHLPEHGMGYQRVWVDLHSGITVKATVLNCEYLEIPDSVDTEDVKRVHYRY